jgi:uroporphyrinogen decarboxylase
MSPDTRPAPTPRQRWLALFQGGSTDRIPCDYWGTDEVTARLLGELGCATERELWERLGVDRCVRVAAVHRLATERTWYLPSLYSVWHIGTREVSHPGGAGVYRESVSHPLAPVTTVSEVERFDWPDPDDWDTSGLRAGCREWSDYPILLGAYEPFLLHCRLRGMEQALRDLMENEALAEAILDRIHFIHESVIRRCLQAASDLIDFLWVGEDLGTQESLLMSPTVFRRFLQPRLAAMIALAHSFGVRVFHHDDGAIRRLIPELLDMGIDILNPIQWRCRGMDRAELAREFGSRVVFHGGIDNQYTLPFGTPEEVRRQVAENLDIFRGCKGYIVAPCHNIQPNTPTRNILALYAAVHEFGRR